MPKPTDFTRRQFVAGATALSAGVLAMPNVLRAQAHTLSWVTHPAIFEATGKGELLKAFEETNKVKVEIVTFPTEALGPRIQQELISRSSSFDVMSLADAFWTTSVARFVEPLDALAAASPVAGGIEDFAPGFIQQFRVPQTLEGPILGIPQRMSCSLLYYRKDLLEAKGLKVPTTIQEFYETAGKLTEGDRFGAVYQGVQGQAGTLDFYEYAAPQGADLLTAPDWKTAAFNTPAGVEALDIRRKLIADKYVSEGVVSYGFDDCINAIAQQRAAMSVLYSAYWPRFEDIKTSQVVGKIGYAPTFADPSKKQAYPARGWCMSVNAASKNKELAWELIKFVTDAPQQKWMAINKGNPVTRLSVLADPEVQAAVPVAAALKDALPKTKVMPNVSQLPKVYDTLGLSLGQALAGAKPAADALAEAEAAVNAILA
ncbi:extracellular solute-binding protein [Corticibacterium sp. UT-5YL-CI-8]|nr:extracellular solute-binding protein [Tianweitania sp. UT-5YL-CI-8]